MKSHKEKEIFGSFYLMNTEFAISACHLQEVVNAPESYIAVPLAPRALKGLFNLRGSFVPVIDLQELLGLKGESHDFQKMAIIELDGTLVGLLFDKTGEVFKNNQEERCDYDQTHSTGIVSGLFKKDGGERIIQILNVRELFKLEHIPKDSNLGKNSLKKRGTRKKSISFVTGPAKCALPITDIQEIIKVEKIHTGAFTSKNFIGTINLRGTTVPVIDFPALLKYRDVDRSESTYQGDRRIIIMRNEKDYFGLLVDAVDSIISFYPDELVSYASREQSKGDIFLGFITGQGESDIMLLDHEKIKMNEEISEMSRVHGKLYNLQERAQNKGGTRRNYITFKIDTTYAALISEVKEIIDYPKNLIRSPSTKEHVLGVHNLRGELVTIVDARSLYQAKTKLEQSGSQKVLVFKNETMHFGLVVDSVESITSIADKDKMEVPKILTQQCADVSEIIDGTDTNGQRKSMFILSIEALSQRTANILLAS